MSGALPSHSCAGAILSHGGVVEAVGRLPASVLVSCRGRKTDEVLTRCDRESKALWTVMREGQSIVVPESDEERSG